MYWLKKHARVSRERARWLQHQSYRLTQIYIQKAKKGDLCVTNQLLAVKVEVSLSVPVSDPVMT